MDIPLELAFHNMTPSTGLTRAVRRHVARLERVYDHIIGCRVVIEMPHKSHRARQQHAHRMCMCCCACQGREIIVRP